MLLTLFTFCTFVEEMFRGMSSEERLSSGQSSSSPSGHGVPPPALDGQESSWIGLLSMFSRPAVSFLQKYLPGRARAAARSDTRAGWTSTDFKSNFLEEEREFLRQLDDIMPLTQHAAPHLTYLQCQHSGAAGLLEPEPGSTLPWLTAESLRELGIQSAEDMDLNLCQQAQVGHWSSARTFLSHVGLSLVSAQEIKHMKTSGGKDWLTEAETPPRTSSGGKSRMWWSSFWGGEESSQKGLLTDPSWAEDGTLTGRLCPPQPAAETKAPGVFVPSGSMLGENTGATEHKEEPANKEGLQTVQNTEGSTPDQRLNIRDHLSSPGAATACSEVALLTPDQDNGYSSLEEEHVQMCQLFMVKAPSEEQPAPETQTTDARAAVETDMEEETCEDRQSSSGRVDEEEEAQEDEEGQEAAEAPPPQCQNKAIAFIMGCPCSDDDSSQSESSDDDDDDDDDGFDSEGSSDLSDSTDDEDDDESDSELDSEAERLWSSLSQSVDPYNPRNFTARLHTSTTRPRTIPTPSTPPSSAQSTPASSPDLTPFSLSSPPLPSSSPPSGPDVWDDSTSASEVDEAESLRLLSSFSCSDPYSPFNFQAPLRTRGPAGAGPRARTRVKKSSQTPSHSPQHTPPSPPRYRKEEAEERLDSGFSELSASSQSCRTVKKVRFCDDVEEFFASCGEEEEDRRGPWEELARDRCRFLRRCQEVEQSIAYCLQPQHRRLVARRLTVLCVQDN